MKQKPQERLRNFALDKTLQTENLTFSFWGATVEVTCGPSDAKDLKFFYGSYLVKATSSPEISVTLACKSWPSRGFFTSSLARDSLEKVITIEDHLDSSRSVERVYRDWSDLVSPFPPLAYGSLVKHFAAFPGALIRSSEGTVVALIGEHYVGKTSIAVSWCQNHKANLISDSFIILDVHNGIGVTFETPLGFRRKNLEKITPILDRVDHRLTVSEDTGLVALVRPEDILNQKNSEGGKIDQIVLISETKDDTASWYRSELKHLGWFSELDLESIESSLPSTMLNIFFPADTTSEHRAKIISQIIRQE